MFNAKPLLLLSSLFTLPLSAFAQEQPSFPSVSVTGHGVVEQRPDTLILTIIVHVEAKQASEAKSLMDQRIDRYFTFLHQHQVTDKQIDAANLSIQPRYQYTENKPAELKGYQATRQLKVTVDNNDEVNLFLDEALKAGLNEIRSVTPAVSNMAQAQAKARQLAITDAIQQAKSLAKGFSAELGSVWSIDYQSNSTPAYAVVSLARMAGGAENSQDKSWQQKIKLDDQVSVTFRLKPHQP